MAQFKKAATSTYREWVKKYSDIYPKAVKCLSNDIESMLYFFDHPKDVWSKIRTTNAIERSFREVRRRTRPMTCFEIIKAALGLSMGLYPI